MSDTDLGSDDDLDRLLRNARPSDAPTPDVRACHRAVLRDAVERTGTRCAPAWGSRRALGAAAVVAAAALGVTFLALRPDRDRAEVTAGPGEPTPQDASPVLNSPACEGRPLPFAVPVGDGFGSPVLGAAHGAPAPDVPGQLVAHWVSHRTAIELRWPADVSQRMLDQLGETREDMEARLANGLSPASYTDADLSADVIESADGLVDGSGYGSFRTEPALDGTYTLAIARYQRTPDPTPQLGNDLRPTWGSGMCSTVQLTVRALDGRADVREDAEALHRALVSEGGPLVPTREHPPLVVDRGAAASLEPPSACRVPDGIDQDPIRAESVAGPGPFATADEALEAYLATQMTTHEGPFGPEIAPTAPEGGYTALALPDGRIAYQWPAGDTAVVGYYFAERGPAGWSITRTEGPSC